MIRTQSIFTCFWRNLPRGRRRKSVRLFVFAGSAMLGAAAASAAPVILNQPFSAHPGDVISLEGSGFGSAPTVYFKPSHQMTPIALATKAAVGGGVIVEVPKTAAFDLYSVWIVSGGSGSPSISLNAPVPMHFDNAEIASGAHFRIFGRNLYVNSVAPTVTLIDVQTKAQVGATVTLSNSSAYYLDVVPSSGVVAGHSYQTNVSNGYGSALSSASIVGHAAGTDYFQIGQPWAYDFKYRNGSGYQPGVPGTNQADHHVFNVKTDPSLKILAKGDGVTNDAAAINAAIVLASANGGIVYLPAGTYNTATTTIAMRSNVVLQGQSAAATKILYGPAYPGGVYFPPGSQMMGLADLSLQNVDLTSQYIVGLGTGNQAVGKVFLQRLNWNFGSGKGLIMSGDRIAILNSTFTQAINYQGGDAKTGGLGPIYIGSKTIGSTTNFQFRNNVVKWATGQNSLLDLVNAVLENNHFTRSASDKLAVGPADPSWGGYAIAVPAGFGYMRVGGRQLSLNWGKNVVIQNNIFDTSDGVISYNWNDGETILNEAGGPSAGQREDVATVSAAASSSVTANPKCSGTCAWNVSPNSIVVIVSGEGASQWRHITQTSGNTFTLDKPFSVIPAPGDHFAISQPGYENAIIRNNTMSGNPFGIAMYKGAFFNASVLANHLTDSGGIYLIPSQSNLTSMPRFNTSQNIEINGNIVKNTKGWYPAYIATFFAIVTQNQLWGTSTFGLEMRNNQITAKPGTPLPLTAEGFGLYDIYQSLNAGNFIDQGTSWVTGTVYQGNSCTNCPINYRLSNTDDDTAIWNAATINSPGVASTFVSDKPMGGTNFGGASPHGSLGTVIGND